MNVNKQTINGHPCRLMKKYEVVQKKTHKNKIINFIYRIIYGYAKFSHFPEQVNMAYMDGVYYFKDKETYKRVSRERQYINSKKRWR